MDYDTLALFLTAKMKMTHVYQPLIIKKLLESNNTATIEEIARVFLNEDELLLEYYMERLRTWPKTTLMKHGIVKYDQDRFTLLIDDITSEQKSKLIKMCVSRYSNYAHNNPNRFSIMNTRIPIPAKLRSIILKKTNGLCAVCNRARPLEIDYIIPLEIGGNNSLENLHALCHKCKIQNVGKNNANLEYQKKMLAHRQKGCALCNPSDVIHSLDLAVAIPARIPATPIHVQILPRRHTGSFQELLSSERHHCMELIELITMNIPNHKSSTFNVNFNVNKSLDHFYIDIIAST